MTKLLLGFLLALATPSHQQYTPSSPCPSVLTYEPRTDPESDRWNGTIVFPAGSNPFWVFMNIVLDSKADILASHSGVITTLDNIDFKIDNPRPEIKRRREPIKFFVKYDYELQVPPKVKVIRLDGKEICNADITIQQPISTTISTPSVPNRISAEECGRVKLNNPVALVVNGASTQEGQWPWQVAIYKIERVNPFYNCGGTLVSKKHVITAAHCTTEKNSNPFQQFDESILSVYLGKHHLVTSVQGAQFKFVEKIMVYPEYKTRTFKYDLSMLLLRGPVQYTQWVQPACLWPDDMIELSHIVGKSGSVVGWGNDGSGNLKLVTMPVVDQETCLRSDNRGDFYLRFTSDYTFCAGHRNGSSPCNGDSGGGMVFNMGGSWYLRGVVSLSNSFNNEAVCDPTQFIVFTDIAQYLPWIRENMSD